MIIHYSNSKSIELLSLALATVTSGMQNYVSTYSFRGNQGVQPLRHYTSSCPLAVGTAMLSSLQTFCMQKRRCVLTFDKFSIGAGVFACTVYCYTIRQKQIISKIGCFSDQMAAKFGVCIQHNSLTKTSSGTLTRAHLLTLERKCRAA